MSGRKMRMDSYKSPSLQKNGIKEEKVIELKPKKKRVPKVIGIYGDDIALLKKRRTDEICRKCGKIIPKGTELIAIQEFVYHFNMPYADKRGWYFHKECGAPVEIEEFHYEPTMDAERVISLLSKIYKPNLIEQEILKKLAVPHTEFTKDESDWLIYLLTTMAKEQQTAQDLDILEKLKKGISF